MKVLQISTTWGRDCGISLFADNLQTHLQRAGIEMTTVTALPSGIRADIILLQHHEELMSDDEVIALAEITPVPLVLFAHSGGIESLCRYVDGLVAMCLGMVGPTDKPIHVFPHPAWVPPHLEDRNNLRREFGLPEARLVVGTHGFLKFERQFAEIIETLLLEARRNDWFIELITSPWRLNSLGLIPQLESLRQQNPEYFRFEYAFLDTAMLNRRLQACDLLWCWTEAPSSPYASGVISDQYASGTRVLAADKQQHGHVLGLPNTVAGPGELAPFIDSLVAELRHGGRQRHDPASVSWENCIDGFASFLQKILR
jgi:hypothetical protein